jgi:hypothetical protein
MLTYIKTPRILIPHVYEPDTYEFDHGRGDRGSTTKFGISVVIDAETEADLPAYIRERVNEATWYGIPKGTRFVNIGSGTIRPAIFGVTTEDLLRAQAMNVDLDQMLRDEPATLCVSMGRKRGKAEGNTWPILRAVHVQSVNLPLAGLQGFHAYTQSRDAHWEFQE